MLTVEPTPNYATSMLPAWLITGLGVALALPQLSSASVQGLPPDRYALGSAVNQTMRQLGATFGVALVVSFIAGATAGDALEHFQRAWWMIVACGALTSIVALALPRPVRVAAAPAPGGQSCSGVTNPSMTWSTPLAATTSREPVIRRRRSSRRAASTASICSLIVSTDLELEQLLLTTAHPGSRSR